MKCNRDSSLAYREMVSLISSAKLEWISVSSRLLDKPQGREEFQDPPGHVEVPPPQVKSKREVGSSFTQFKLNVTRNVALTHFHVVNIRCLFGMFPRGTLK